MTKNLTKIAHKFKNLLDDAAKYLSKKRLIRQKYLFGNRAIGPKRGY